MRAVTSLGTKERRGRKTLIKLQQKNSKVKQTMIIDIKPRSPVERAKVKLKIKKKREVDKHKANIRTILLNSNATPIGRYGGIGYACCFCTKQFAIPIELKTHTLTEHEKSTSIFMENITMPAFIVKLDITNLKCRLCTDNIENLDDLIDHLKLIHKKYFNDLKSHVLPFKFGGDLIKCVICDNEYNNFKVLLEHMNNHFRNYVCDICGSGFVNKRILQTHSYRHKTGVYNCGYCSKVFDTRVKQKDHERVIHVFFNKRSKCGYCGERFTDYTKKNNHEVKVHGAKPVVLRCQACEKVFDNKRSLTVHIKAYHLMERRVPK